MLKYIESFDHIGAGLAGTDLSLYTALGWSVSGFGLSNGTGRFGTNSLLRNQYGNGIDGTITPAIISRKCDKMVVGFSTRGQFAINAQFCYGSFVNFSIVCVVNAQGAMTVKLCTGPASLAFYMEYSCSGSYPAITCDYEYTGNVSTGALGGTVPGIPWPGSLAEDYHFVELYVDVTDYMNGRAKVAVDGRTYVDESGIVTAAYLGFGSNPYDDRAKLDRVNLYVRSSANLGISGGPVPLYFDSLYLSDDQGGYQDDFLGDIFVKTAYPVVDGTKRNWMPYVNGTIIGEGEPHHELINSDPIQPGDETEYLEADQDLTEEMIGFGTDPIPAGSELIAVNHRTMFRNVASPGSPKSNSLVPLFQMQGNPIIETNSMAKRGVGWNYYFLDVYYNLVPGFATPWAEYLLEQSQFGFMLRSAESMQPHVDEFLLDDWAAGWYILDETIVDDLGMLDDSEKNPLDVAIWSIIIDEDLCAAGELDWGDLYLEDTLDLTGEQFGILALLGNRYIGGTGALLHFDGTGESQTFTDSSGKVWTAHGGAKISTGEYVFSSSGYFDGAGDYITTPTTSDFDLGQDQTSSFTMDFWFKTTATKASVIYGDRYETPNSGRGWSVSINRATNDGKLYWATGCGQSGNYLECTTTVGGYNDGDWHHAAFVRVGTAFKIYIGGVERASVTYGFSPYPGQNPAIAREPYYGSDGQYDYAGWIDEFRILKGVAAWTAAFIPSSSGYDARTGVLDLNGANSTVSPSDRFGFTDEAIVDGDGEDA